MLMIILQSVNYNLHSKLYLREFYVNQSFSTLKLYSSNKLFLRSQIVVYCIIHCLH